MPRRQYLARIYGADVIADFSKEDVVQRILDLTNGQGVDTAIEALGSDLTFQNAIKVTKAGGTISNVGYHGHGDFVHLPRIEWGVCMAEKTIMTGLCPGGRLRMERLLRVLEMKRVDPTLMTTHTFPFREMERAFQIMDKKLDGVLKPLIVFQGSFCRDARRGSERYSVGSHLPTRHKPQWGIRGKGCARRKGSSGIDRSPSESGLEEPG